MTGECPKTDSILSRIVILQGSIRFALISIIVDHKNRLTLDSRNTVEQPLKWFWPVRSRLPRHRIVSPGTSRRTLLFAAISKIRSSIGSSSSRLVAWPMKQGRLADAGNRLQYCNGIGHRMRVPSGRSRRPAHRIPVLKTVIQDSLRSRKRAPPLLVVVKVQVFLIFCMPPPGSLAIGAPKSIKHGLDVGICRLGQGGLAGQ